MIVLQGNVEAYGNYEKIQAQGVELMEFLKPQSEEEDEIFTPCGGECAEEEQDRKGGE